MLQLVAVISCMSRYDVSVLFVTRIPGEFDRNEQPDKLKHIGHSLDAFL
jgi:hypothetical protein